MCPRPTTQNTPLLIIAFDEENQKPTIDRKTPNQVSTNSAKCLLKRLICPFANQHLDQDAHQDALKQEASWSYKLKTNLETSFVAPAASLMYDVLFGVYNDEETYLDMSSSSQLCGPSSQLLDPNEIDQSIDLDSLCIDMANLSLSSSDSSEGFFCGNDHRLSSCRLNEEITQIDVARMNHVTAQQLGLEESMSSLPIVSYGQCVIPASSDTSMVNKGEDAKEETRSQHSDSKRSSKATTPLDSINDHIGCIERFALLSNAREPKSPLNKRNPPGCSLCTDHPIQNVTTASIQTSIELSSLSSNSNDEYSIPSWSFVQVGGSLEDDKEDVDLSSNDDSTIPSWSFERLGDILDQQGRA